MRCRSCFAYVDLMLEAVETSGHFDDYYAEYLRALEFCEFSEDEYNRVVDSLWRDTLPCPQPGIA